MADAFNAEDDDVREFFIQKTLLLSFEKNSLTARELKKDRVDPVKYGQIDEANEERKQEEDGEDANHAGQKPRKKHLKKREAIGWAWSQKMLRDTEQLANARPASKVAAEAIGQDVFEAIQQNWPDDVPETYGEFMRD